MHSIASMGSNAIAESFPDVIWHTETPLTRTAPAPMFHLADLFTVLTRNILGGMAVLVVDDEAPITELLSTALRYMGYDVNTARTGSPISIVDGSTELMGAPASLTRLPTMRIVGSSSRATSTTPTAASSARPRSMTPPGRDTWPP